jgi:arginine decarboxylase-like protein
MIITYSLFSVSIVLFVLTYYKGLKITKMHKSIRWKILETEKALNKIMHDQVTMVNDVQNKMFAIQQKFSAAQKEFDTMYQLGILHLLNRCRVEGLSLTALKPIVDLANSLDQVQKHGMFDYSPTEREFLFVTTKLN